MTKIENIKVCYIILLYNVFKTGIIKQISQ